MKKNPKILFVSYECAPFFKIGGLADVAGSLPKALKELSVDIRVIMPYYKTVKKKYPKLEKVKSNLKIKVAGEKLKVNILKSNLPSSKVPIYFIDNQKYFQVKNIFDKKERTRFVLFSHLVIELINKLNWQPDVIHCNDWQAGMIPLIIKTQKTLKHPEPEQVRFRAGKNTLNQNKFGSGQAKSTCLDLAVEPRRIKTLFTIHNIGYAGRTLMSTMRQFGFKQNDFSQIKDNKVNIMHEAILNADLVSTVSPTYAKEILSSEFGYQMAPALRKRKKDLYGILNGLDYKIFNPQVDKNLKTQYGPKTINKKLVNKLHLQKISQLRQDKDVPLIGMVSRLAGQKGFDILKTSFSKLINLNLQLIILGTGNKDYERFFKRMSKQYPDKFKAFLKFDSKLARQIYAGADIFLMPSKYEPCGLGQLIAMKYGTVPIVRATGGLKDTIINYTETLKHPEPEQVRFRAGKNTKILKATGFSFDKYNSQELLKAVQQALKVFKDKKQWQKLQKNCLQQDFSWHTSAKKYLELYLKLISRTLT